ncbi:unnamed protein product [marine sediment metagenome]|uniref:NTP pyrophosphohydrolase MazG putative catalytic core domain-containing protein n=1 Tax=marine sediment metagenome TaxID=412755 RepID=X0S2N0_9ZZZZ
MNMFDKLLSKKMDMFKIMVTLQDELNGKFSLSSREISEMELDERLIWIRKYMEAAVIEVGEVIMAAKGRWWKIDKDYKGMENVREEIIDLLHFVLAAGLASGMTAEDIFERYCDKNQRNHTRKDWAINNEP